MLPIAQALAGPLSPLKKYPQFMLWKIANKRGKLTKLPISPYTLEPADAHSPQSWIDADTALSLAEAAGPEYGVAFVFTAADPFYFLDIDHALKAGEWSDLANEMLAKLPGAAVEVSQSHSGLHVIGTAPNPPEHAKKNIKLGLELYTSKRFIALTGINAIGDAAQDSSIALAQLIEDYFKPKVSVDTIEWREGPVEGYDGIEDNDLLIAKALESGGAAGAFGGAVTFRDIWEGNTEALAKKYPDPSGQRSYDASSADMALAQHLAFWTGKDHARILTLMGNSALVRDKWARQDYLIRTIQNAVANQTDVYSRKRNRIEPMEPVVPTPPMAGQALSTFREGYQYLAPTQQAEYFAGCVYVQDIHRIFTPEGSMLKPEQFKATYGGYIFAMDAQNDRPTRNAWEAFTESQAIKHPKVNSTIFKPALPTGEIIEKDGRSYVNTYVPIATPRLKGDPKPFLDHLAKVLPLPSDQAILLAYMAAVVQHKGVKFQWAPLLQGAEGNGKTLFTRCVAYAIGSRYVHYPKANDLDNKFNGWLLNKMFIGIEDIYVPAHKTEILEILKPMITSGDGLEIQLKGVDQITVDICANFMLNSNHKDAIRKTRTDRRFAVFFTAQQQAEDLAKDGMGGNYFPDLYKWLNAEGYAIVADYLESYQIPDHLNPATACHRAPVTSSTEDAIAAGMGGIEQEIMEAIEAGVPGFCGGWISSIALDRLLDSLKRRHVVPRNKRRDLLRSLGYEWHPGLVDGRVNNKIPLDGGKPKLFIKVGHPQEELSSQADIVNAYTVAQGVEGDLGDLFKQEVV